MPDLITELAALITAIGIFIPLIIALIQRGQSIQQEYEKSFRAIVEKLSAGKKEERIAAASSLGTFIKKSGFIINKRGKFYDEAVSVLLNTVSTELDPNVLNAIRSSLLKIEKKDNRGVIQRLLDIDRNFFVYKHPMTSWIKTTNDDTNRSEKEYTDKETSSKEDGSKVNRILLDNLKKDIIQKHEMHFKFEKDLTGLNINEMFVTNFICSLLKPIDYIDNIEFYHTAMNEIALTDFELKQSKIRKADFSKSAIDNIRFNNVIINDSIFKGSRITKSKFIKCKIDSSSFDQVNFEDVDFSGSEFKDVYFTGADLTGVSFKDTKGLKGIYFYKAENVDKAIFDDKFKKELDETSKHITTDDGFKEYINNESDLSKEHGEHLFTTLEELKLKSV